jgi:hypothetical protein
VLNHKKDPAGFFYIDENRCAVSFLLFVWIARDVARLARGNPTTALLPFFLFLPICSLFFFFGYGLRDILRLQRLSARNLCTFCVFAVVLC